MKISFRNAMFLALLSALPLAASAQTGRRKTTAKPRKPTPAAVATPQPMPETVPETPVKKNERPLDTIAAPTDAKANGRDSKNNAVSPAKSYVPAYFYEFDRPGFTYPRILIEHDDAGKGAISFKKEGFEDHLTDPIQLSPATVEKLKASFAALKFLDSTTDYQYAAHDFSNMGNVTITLKRDGRARVAKYNWTENKDAKFLMDEYRRIGNEYTWKFEMTLARENQPLQTPGLMDALDSYFRQNEISDPPHLMPFLTELSMDERLPLIARNHATKLIKQIEKVKK